MANGYSPVKLPVITRKNARKVVGLTGKAVYVVMGLLRKAQYAEQVSSDTNS